ncbi:MAG: hypothetical protein IT314_00460 [Anaerolineales bacterium]|nr:hypothetical protein [Anaerolineales bacterium]
MSKKSKQKKENDDNAAVRQAIVSGRVTIIVAIIGLIGTLAGLLLNFGPFVNRFNTPIPPTTASIPTLMPTVSFTPEPTSILTLIVTPTETLTPTATFTPTLPPEALTPTSSLPIGMQVKVTSNPPGGKAPLTVKFDARDSFVRAPDGTLFECRKGGCSYIWYVYKNGEQFRDPQKTNGTLELRLEKHGNYFVSVYICHGADAPTCGSGGTVVIVE